jgi:hypothetical protein
MQSIHALRQLSNQPRKRHRQSDYELESETSATLARGNKAAKDDQHSNNHSTSYFSKQAKAQRNEKEYIELTIHDMTSKVRVVKTLIALLTCDFNVLCRISNRT